MLPLCLVRYILGFFFSYDTKDDVQDYRIVVKKRGRIGYIRAHNMMVIVNYSLCSKTSLDMIKNMIYDHLPRFNMSIVRYTLHAKIKAIIRNECHRHSYNDPIRSHDRCLSFCFVCNRQLRLHCRSKMCWQCNRNVKKNIIDLSKPVFTCN